MPSFSSLFTHLTGAGFYYQKNSRHASYNFSQEGQSLYLNQPRFPFEYYVDIKLYRLGSAEAYFKEFFNNTTWGQVQPLIKSIDMPSFKIQTDALNQYNRKRISQTRINFEPIKMVVHDVADGKTLKFWEMYYRYYFQDGTEPDKNVAKQATGQPARVTTEQFLKNITPAFNPNLVGLPASIKKAINGNLFPGLEKPTNDNGDKSAIQNIVKDTLDNHKFGFNLPTVQNIRNLIKQIDIYQVHGGRFNQVSLINPRISAFTHDNLNYATGDRTLELTFTFEYEYAYYIIQNLKLGDESNKPQNNSTIEQFEHGEFLELPALAFNASLMNFVESNNPLLQSDNPILQRIGKNVQATLGSVTGAVAAKAVHRVTSSALDGLAHISPTPHNPISIPKIATRPFASVPSINSLAYKDVSRVGGLLG